MPMFERLETRRLMAVTATLTHAGTLIIQGTSQSDHILVSKQDELISWGDGGVIIVTADSLRQADSAPHEGSFDAALVKRVRVEGAAGHDDIEIGLHLQRPCTVVGGDGNDSIWGGNFSETLSGGSGDDGIFSKFEHVNRRTAAVDAHIRAGRDFDGLGAYDRVSLLVGGNGNDTIAPAANDHIDGGRGDDTIRSEIYTKDNSIILTKGSAEVIFAQNTSLIEHYALPDRIFFY